MRSERAPRLSRPAAPRRAAPRHAAQARVRVRNGTQASVLTLAFAGVLSSLPGLAHAQLAPGTLPTGGVARNIGQALPVIGTPSRVNGINTLVVDQKTPGATRAWIDWQTFSIAGDSRVQFLQNSAGDSIINRVTGGSGAAWKSLIEGQISAIGTVMLLNQNGILFDRNSQVNVGTFVASTLAINEVSGKNFLFNGVGSSTNNDFQNNPALSGVATGLGYVPEIELRGEINAAAGGKVMVFGPRIQHTATATTRAPDGQVILAAGEKVWLTESSTNSALRGFVVEFKAPTGVNLSEAMASSTVSNAGVIEAARGNVTLAGLALNHSGRVSASSAAVFNGSVILSASETTRDSGVNPQRLGTATLAKGSVTETPLLVGDGTLTEGTDYSAFRSRIDIDGGTLVLQGDVRSPGGNVNLTAGGDDTNTGAGATSRVFIDAGATVSSAGNWADLAATDRLVTIRVTSNELKDTPDQKGGILLGKTLSVDAYKFLSDGNGGTLRGTALFGTPGDRTTTTAGTLQASVVESFFSLQQRDVGRKATAGGDITINSKQGDVIVRDGALIDISGGGLRFAGGRLATSSFLSNGRILDVGSATAGQSLGQQLDTYTPFHSERWAAYVKPVSLASLGAGNSVAPEVFGSSAGKLTLLARDAMVLAGAVRSRVVAGSTQLDAARLPLAGTLVSGVQPSSSSVNALLRFSSLGTEFDLGDVDKDVKLSTWQGGRYAGGSFLPGAITTPVITAQSGQTTLDGLSVLEVYANERVDVAAGARIAVLPGASGSIKLGARAVDVKGAISAPGGAVSLLGYNTSATGTTWSVSLGSASLVSTAGLWVNETAAGANSADLAGLPAALPRVVDAGSITIRSRDITTASGSMLDASGGARLSGTGTLTAGKGGSISIQTGFGDQSLSANNAATVQDSGTVLLGGQARALSATTSGTITLTTDRMRVAESGALAGETLVAPSWFAGGDSGRYRGFGQVSLSAFNSLVVGSGGAQSVSLAPVAENIVYDPTGVGRLASGTPLGAMATTQVLTQDKRAPVNVSLSTLARQNNVALRIDANATVATDPKGKITVSGTDGVEVRGTLEAPAGSISVSASNSAGDVADTSFSIVIGSQARLLARGAFVRQAVVPFGQQLGSVLAGGGISLSGNRTSMSIEQGAVLDVSGASGEIDISGTSGGARTLVRTLVASDAGSIGISNNARTTLLGSFVGQPGGASSAGGSLAVDLTNRGLQSTDPDFSTESRRLLLAATPAGFGAVDPNVAELRLPVSSLSADGALRTLASNGIDKLRLRSDGEIRFAGSTDLALGRSLRLDAPVLSAAAGAAITLGAPSLALGSRAPSVNALDLPAVVAPTAGTATLTATAQRAAGAAGAADGGQLELFGHLRMDGFAGTRADGSAGVKLQADGDIRLTGNPARSSGNSTDPVDLLVGALRTTGSIEMSAAQVLASTFSDYTLSVTSAANSGFIRVRANGGTQGAALSAAGAISLLADNVYQDGVLRAPFGAITLGRDPALASASVLGKWRGTAGSFTLAQLVAGTFTQPAATQLVQVSAGDLATGSLTTVSGAGLTVPFGTTSGGVTWQYRYGTGDSEFISVTRMPTKQISLRGTRVTTAAGSTLDVSGGGEVFGLEYLSGSGGTTDFLASTAAAKSVFGDVYAILPAGSLASMPVDRHIASRQDLGLGADAAIYDTIYLSGTGGLPAGRYTLLPGYYAMLPGAWIVRPQSGYTDLQPGTRATLADGTAVVSGYRVASGTGIRESRTSGFTVAQPQRLTADNLGKLRQAEYTYTTSQFFADSALSSDRVVPAQPRDGGRVSVSATSSLSLAGTLNASGLVGSGGNRLGNDGEVEITAAAIALVNRASATSAKFQSFTQGDWTTPFANFVQLEVGQLNALGTRLSIGATRASDGSTLNVGTSELVFMRNADAPAVALQAPDVLLAATSKLSLLADSSVVGRGTLASAASLSASGTGALLRASAAATDGRFASFTRSGVTNPGAGATPGVLTVASGASVTGDGAVLLDATRVTVLDGALSIGSGGSAQVASAGIALGRSGVLANTLSLGSDVLGSLAGASALTLRAYNSIDFYGTVALGNANLALTLDAPGIGGFTDTSAAQPAVTLTGDRVALVNTRGNLLAPATWNPNGAGTLRIDARLFESGAGTRVLRGYGTVTVPDAQAMLATGTGTLNIIAAAPALNVNAARITGGAGAVQAVTLRSNAVADTNADGVPDSNDAATLAGSLTITQGTRTASADSLPAPGASLALSAGTLTQGGRIEMPSGAVTLAAGSGGLSIGAGSYTGAAGFVKTFFDGSRGYGSGGSVTLNSSAGISLSRLATLDVGATQGADAGTLAMAATGALSLESDASLGVGTFSGSALSGQAGGSFRLQAATLNRFGALQAALNTGGFRESRDVRVTGVQDLVIAAGESITSRNLKLTADQGKVQVDGSIDASSTLGGGRVELNGATSVQVAGSITAAGLSAGTGSSDKYSSGGLIRLSSPQGTINFTGTLDVGAYGKGDAGRAEFILPQGSAGALAAATLTGTVKGRRGFDGSGFGGEVVVYGHQRTDVSASATLSNTAAQATYNAFMNGANYATTRNNLRTGAGSITVNDGLSSSDIFLRASVELYSTNDLALTSSWNLSSTGTGNTWFAQSEPGLLTIRSAGTLRVGSNSTVAAAANNSTNTTNLGFIDDIVRDEKSWTIRLVGGAQGSGSTMSAADLTAVRPLSAVVAANTGDFVLSIPVPATSPSNTSTTFTTANTRIRTGSGDIEIAAARDFAFSYAGTGADALGSLTATRAQIVTRSAIFTTGRPAFTDLAGAATANINGSRYLNRGGDVLISAQRNASGLNMDAVTANAVPYVGDWLRRTSRSGGTLSQAGWWASRPYFSQEVATFGGGDIRIVAGGGIDRLSALVVSSSSCADTSTGCAATSVRQGYGGGNLTLLSGGDITGGEYLVSNGAGRVQAGGALQSYTVAGATAGTAFYLMGDAPGDAGRGGASLAVEARGAATVQNISNPTLLVSTTQTTPTAPTNANQQLGFGGIGGRANIESYSATDSFSLVSDAGDITLLTSVRPSRGGSTNLGVAPPRLALAGLAGGISGSSTTLGSPNTVTLNPSASQRLSVLAAKDITRLRFEGSDTLVSLLPTTASATFGTGTATVIKFVNNTSGRMVSFDQGASWSVVAEGSIRDGQLYLPGASTIRAGQDIIAQQMDLQNLSGSDLTVVRAGRDARWGTYSDGVTPVGGSGGYLYVGGPGTLLLQAGRNIDLGKSSGVSAVGQTNNSFLSGVTDGATSATVNVVAGYGGDAKNYGPDVSRAGVATLFGELREAGKANDAVRGDKAAAALFDSRYLNAAGFGNVTMYQSAITSDANGGINLMTPAGSPGSSFGGNINAGLPVAVASNRDLGIISNGGPLRAFMQNSLNVNQSRVVALQGGEILAYTSNGNIDAGKGSQTVRSTKALLEKFTDPTTQVTYVKVKADASGSGIRAVTGDPDGGGPLQAPAPGSIFLFAPRGAVDAGEAGIVSQGNIVIVAQVVLNAANIQAGGATSGVPVAQSGGAGAGIAAASGSAASAGQGAGEAARAATGNQAPPAFRPSFITVEVIGVGS